LGTGEFFKKNSPNLRLLPDNTMKLLLIFLTSVLLISCSQDKKVIVHVEDYNAFLTVKQTSNYSIEEDMNFWRERLVRMPQDEASKIKLAGLYSANFRKTGDVENLKISDSIYHILLKHAAVKKAGLYLGLAQNSITQHQFKQAEVYADSSLQQGGKEAASLLVITDVALELGYLAKAKKTLKRFTNKNSFAHLIRQTKVKDQEGKLDTAILIMEKAFDRIKGNKDLYCWALSNLGDMYGHAGRIEDAYRAYLSVLKKDPAYDYALKGIAWIALSHDHNYSEATRIINILASKSRMPEAHLMLAEIAAMQNNELEKIKQLKSFTDLTDHAGYKVMYAKYLAEIYAEDLDKPEASLAIAENEINNRPTPQSFDLQAWALLHAGRKKEALIVTHKYVEGKTFEPDAAYHTGMIYLANGFHEEAEKFLLEALESSFELGPAITLNIQDALKKI
jgi:tetratricopeptide (TPR) repeat protein